MSKDGATSIDAAVWGGSIGNGVSDGLNIVSASNANAATKSPSCK